MVLKNCCKQTLEAYTKELEQENELHKKRVTLINNGYELVDH